MSLFDLQTIRAMETQALEIVAKAKLIPNHDAPLSPAEESLVDLVAELGELVIGLARQMRRPNL